MSRVVAAAAVLGALGCAAAAIDAPAETLLASADAAGTRFALYATRCRQGECDMEIRRLRGNGSYDLATLDWKVDAGALDAAQEDRWQGAAGLLTDEGQAAVTVGEEYRALTTSLEALTLDGAPGVLVRQRAGFEHLKRRFYLFAVAKDRLQRIWSADEGTGPYRSGVAVVRAADGTVSLLYLKGFSPDAGEAADTLEVTRLQPLEGGAAIVEQKVREVSAIRVVPGYDSATAARAALGKSWPCLSGYWLLDAGRFKARIPGAIALAAVAATPELARNELSRVNSCLNSGEARLDQIVEGTSGSGSGG